MTTRPPLISMPKQLEWDDVQLHWLRHVPMGRYATPHRIRHLDEALTRIRRLGDVWQTHAGGIARSYRAASSANTSSVDLTRP